MSSRCESQQQVVEMPITNGSSKGKTLKKKKDVKGDEQTHLYCSSICYLCIFLWHSSTVKLNKVTVKGQCNLASFPFFNHISEKV